jgi:signal transduction histidine kinase
VISINRNPSEDLILRKSKRLHVVLLKLIAVYALVFFVVNMLSGQEVQGFVTLAVLPSTGIAWLLFVKGYYMYSKIWNSLQISIFILLLELMAGAESYAFAFLIPVFIGNMVNFQSKERAIAYALSAIQLAMLIFAVTTDLRIGSEEAKHINDLQLERTLNLIGVVFACVLQVHFVTKVNNEVHSRNIENAKILDEKNRELMTTVYTRDKMMSVLTHDLRAPIASLQSGLELMKMDSIEHRNMDLIARLQARTADTLALLNNLLLWSKQQTHKLQFSPDIVSLTDLTDTIERFGKVVCGEKALHFSVQRDFAPDCVIRCDRNMMEVIFRNLISNSVKFTPAGGIVGVSLKQSQDEITLCVKDDGIGMSAAQMANVLQNIGIDEAVKEQGTGGLGLQLVSEFVRMHGSQLDITSQPGEGSSFCFTIKLS